MQEGKRKRGEFLPLLFFWRLFFFLFFVFFDSLSKYHTISIIQSPKKSIIPQKFQQQRETTTKGGGGGGGVLVKEEEEEEEEEISKIPSPKGHSRGHSKMSRRDPESLERENDRNLETMGDRVSMLKNITMDIHKEADSHHRILDGMRDDMSGFQGVLNQTVQQFSKVLETKNGRYFCYLFAFFIGMWLLSKIIFA
mgnify:CR=1 FL=1